MNNMEEREQKLAVQIIRLWKRPEVRQRFKNIAALRDSFAYKGKSSEESFKDTTTQAHIDVIKKEIETKIKASSASREEINTASASGAKIKPAPARQTTSDTAGDVFAACEKLFAEHIARLRSFPLYPACEPERRSEFMEAIKETTVSWAKGDLETLKKAVEKTKSLYRKTSVIAEGSHPLL